MRYRLERTDDLALEFDGELAAEESSDDGERARWTVLRLYTVDGDRGWVVESEGHTTVPGEVTLRSAAHCRTVGEVFARLRKSDDRGVGKVSYITSIGWELLLKAHAAGALVLPDTEHV